jgi:ATP-dependent RNA helicase DeaD
VRVYRSRLPGAEEVGDPNFQRDSRPIRSREEYAPREGARFGEGREDSPRGEGPRKAGPRGNTVWFVLNIGRKDGADPRQLLPMLCRRGKITRDEVGAIRIFDKETKVEIDADVAERFYELAKAVDRDKIVIEPVTGEEERRPAKPFAEKASHAPSAYARPERDMERAPAGLMRRSLTRRSPTRRSPMSESPYEGGEKKPYEGKKKAYEGKGKPFGAAKPYDPVRSDRDALSDPNVSFRSGPKPYAGKPGAAKPYAGNKPGFGGKPAGKPFKGKKPGRDDRG